MSFGLPKRTGPMMPYRWFCYACSLTWPHKRGARSRSGVTHLHSHFSSLRAWPWSVTVIWPCGVLKHIQYKENKRCVLRAILDSLIFCDAYSSWLCHRASSSWDSRHSPTPTEARLRWSLLNMFQPPDSAKTWLKYPRWLLRFVCST